jgi:hypothetical protein
MATKDSITQSRLENMVIQIANLVLYPAGILQVWSYRLIGIKATYRWGYIKAWTDRPVNDWQYGFSKLFPVAVLCLIIITLRLLLG